jgi:DNA-binding beta-propeller fold protein YncE
VIADESNDRIRVVAESTGTLYGQPMKAGDIYTVAGGGTGGIGDGGPAANARLGFPQGAIVDGAGNLVIADTFDERIRVVAESSGTFYSKAMTAGDIYTVAGNGGLGFSGDGRRGTQAQLELPEGVAVTAAGALLIADSTNNRIRMLAG